MYRRQALRAVTALTAGGVAGCLGTDQTAVKAGQTEAEQDQLDPEEDVSGDGFTVRQKQELLDDTTVGRMDIFVEIDWTPGNRPDPDALDRLVAVYDSAPVERDHGAEDGINLHIVYGETVPEPDGPTGIPELQECKRNYFENSGRGHHYALFVEEIDGEMMGMAEPGEVLIQTDIPEAVDTTTVQLFAHEFGHALGLEPELFDGIDSTIYGTEEYPSVMNYEVMFETNQLDFSDGTNGETDFDEWEFIATDLYIPDTSELKT